MRGTQQDVPIVRMALMMILALPITTLQAAPPAAPNTPTTQPGLSDLRTRAIEQIIAAARSKDTFIRANAMETTMSVPQHALPLVRLALDDAQPAVRYAALVTIGRLRLEALAPAVRQKLNDSSKSVQAAALFALRRCGASADISPMAAMLASPDPQLRGNVALLIGWLGDKSASEMLKETARAPMPKASPTQAALARLQVAEALARLDDPSGLASIRAAAFSTSDEARVMAVQMMGRLGDRQMERAVADMLAKPPVELQLSAAETLGRLGKNDGLNIALQAAQSPIPTVRAQTAITLGAIGSPRAHEAMLRLLSDAEESVRIAAAAGVLMMTSR